jgi:hypothetical protein
MAALTVRHWASVTDVDDGVYAMQLCGSAVREGEGQSTALSAQLPLRLACSDMTVRLYDIARLAPCGQCIGHVGRINDIEAAPAELGGNGRGSLTIASHC